jgi:hypothetical protein
LLSLLSAAIALPGKFKIVLDVRAPSCCFGVALRSNNPEQLLDAVLGCRCRSLGRELAGIEKIPVSDVSHLQNVVGRSIFLLVQLSHWGASILFCGLLQRPVLVVSSIKSSVCEKTQFSNAFRSAAVNRISDFISCWC